MRNLILTTAALLTLAQPAFAISPCRTERLKSYECESYDPVTDTRLKLTVSRYRVLPMGGRRICKFAGQIGEGVSATVSVARQGRFTDLYFTKTKPELPLSQLEAGQPLSLEFYSAGLTTEPERARAEIIPSSEGLHANLDFVAKVNSIYSQPGFERIEVQGTAACRAH